VVDVDSSLKDISEEYFLQDSLSEKVKFYSQSSRYFITNSIKNNKTYDAVVIDVYV
jgi:spermidine synthase